MTPETALNLIIVATLLATVGLIGSEVRMNLLRERQKDAGRQPSDAPVAGAGTPFADVLQPPRSTKTKH